MTYITFSFDSLKAHDDQEVRTLPTVCFAPHGEIVSNHPDNMISGPMCTMEYSK